MESFERIQNKIDVVNPEFEIKLETAQTQIELVKPLQEPIRNNELNININTCIW